MRPGRGKRRFGAACFLAIFFGFSLGGTAAAQQMPRVAIVNLLESQPRISQVGSTVFGDKSSSVGGARLLGAEIAAQIRAEIEAAGMRVVEAAADSRAVERLRKREFIANNNALKLRSSANRWLPQIFGSEADLLVILQHMPKRSGLLGGPGPTGMGFIRVKGMPGVPDEAQLYLSYGVSVVRREPLELLVNSPSSILLFSPSTAGVLPGQQQLDASAIDRMSDVLVKAAVYCAASGLGRAGLWRSAVPSCETHSGKVSLTEYLLDRATMKGPWE